MKKDDKNICGAKTKAGRQCKNSPINGSDYCHIESHQAHDPLAGLTDKQRRFIDEYMVDCNATQAAIRAGYSASTAYSIGWENLRKPEIQAAIQQMLKERQITIDEAIKQLSDHSRASVAPFVQWDQKKGTLEITLGTDTAQRNLHLIKKIKQRDTILKKGSTKDPEEIIGRTFEIEIHDSQSALDKIVKILGGYAPIGIDIKSLDLSTLSDPQLERIAAGENVIAVLATSLEEKTAKK